MIVAGNEKVGSARVWATERERTLDLENKLLRKTAKAYVKLCLHYRIGKNSIPEWVLDTISEAKEKFGDDFSK